MRKSITTFLLLLFCTRLVLAQGKEKDNRKALEEALRSNYKLTKTATLERNNVTSPGTVFVIEKDGLAADLASDATFFTSKVQNGEVSQRGGAAALFSKRTTKRLMPGDRVYLIDLDVKDDRLRLGMLTVEMTAIQEKGSTKQTRYRGYVDFEFPKEIMLTMDVDSAKKAIQAVLIPEDKFAGTKTKTIELDQTVDQVEGTLGKPITVAKLGAKTIYTYKDMKVIFTDGKVTDVQ
jgi:hypothetical protein